MKKETKAKKALANLKDWLVDSGHSVDHVEKLAEATPLTADQIHLQVDAVLLYLEKPARFIIKICKYCKEPFGTNYRAVAYWSNSHRAKVLYQETGIRWNPHKSEHERWGGEPPLIIPPMAVSKLREFAEQLLAQLPESVPPILQPVSESPQYRQLKVDVQATVPLSPVVNKVLSQSQVVFSFDFL